MVSMLLKHKSNLLFWIGYLRCRLIGQFLMKMSVFSSRNSTSIWNTLISSNSHVLSWLIILQSTYQNPVYLPHLSGARECINSITHSGIGIWFWCPSLLPWTFSVYFLYNLKHFFWASTFDDFNLWIRIPCRNNNNAYLQDKPTFPKTQVLFHYRTIWLLWLIWI